MIITRTIRPRIVMICVSGTRLPTAFVFLFMMSSLSDLS